MFLISAHQTYLNHKLLQKRLLFSSEQEDDEEITDKNENHTESIEKRNFDTSRGYIIRAHLAPMSTSCSSVYNNQKERVQVESLLMQRTRKYFTSNGHKFLFNNT